MKLYKFGSDKLTVDGVDYLADEKGIIDIPDSQVSSSVWSMGFSRVNAELFLALNVPQLYIAVDSTVIENTAVVNESTVKV